jgi:hypothetical protein
MNAPRTASYTPTAAEQYQRQQARTSKPPMSHQGLLEPVARKRARPVLRGPWRSNAPGLPDEIFFGIITRQAIRRGSYTSVKDLVAAIEVYIDAWNERCAPFTWTKTADQILNQARRPATSNKRH